MSKSNYNSFTNTSINYQDRVISYQKPSINPLNKNSLGQFSYWELTQYYQMKHYFMERIKIEGISENENFTSYDVMDKILNGTMCFIKVGGRPLPVNIMVRKWNYLNHIVEFVVNEPKSKKLNGRIYNSKINNDANKKKKDSWAEVRFNFSRNSLFLMDRYWVSQLYEIYKLSIMENSKIFPKKILNQNIIQQTQNNKVALSNIEQRPETIHTLDLKAGNISKFDDNNNDLSIDIDYKGEISERIIVKWNFTQKERKKAHFIETNEANDKKHANVITKELEVDNSNTNKGFQHYINIINLDLKKVNNIFGTKYKAVDTLQQDLDKIEKEQDTMKGNEYEK